MTIVSRFLNIDKPPGMTSRDVVNRVVRIVGDKRAGHAGTLDPLASGVLVVAVGKATRLVEYVQQLPKTYETIVSLGRTSDTDDTEGTVVETAAPAAPAEALVRAALAGFVGEIAQRPPAYSALKVGGRRSYELARMGRAAPLPTRRIRIDAIELLEYHYPEVRLRIVCGGGTYIRAIARDLGETLGIGGLMQSLRRTAIGHFKLDSATQTPVNAGVTNNCSAIRLDDLTSDNWMSLSWSIEDALRHIPWVQLNEEQQRRFGLGQAIELLAPAPPPGELAVLSPAGRFLGIGRLDPQSNVLHPSKGGFG